MLLGRGSDNGLVKVLHYPEPAVLSGESLSTVVHIKRQISGFVGRILEHVRYLTSIPVPMLCDMMEYQYQDMPELEWIARILELEYNKIARGLYLPINISCRLGNPESGTGATCAATM